MSTPSYYPPGWDLEKLKGTNPGELEALPQDVKNKMLDGLRAEIGPAGMRPIIMGIYGRPAQAPAPPPTNPPEYAETLTKLHNAGKNWGYVVFKAVDTDKDTWDRFLKKWYAITDQVMDYYKGIPIMEDVKSRFKCIFVQDAESNEARSPGEIAKRYRALDGVPELLRHPLCLAVTPASLKSVLNSEIPKEQIPWTDRASVPIVQLIDEHFDGNQNEDGYLGLTNIAVESLIDPLFDILASQIMDVHEIFVGAGPKDIYLRPFRDGVRKGVIP